MKQKIKIDPSHNIKNYSLVVLDMKSKEFKGSMSKVGFNTSKEAEEYIESHERPNDLHCIFQREYIKSKLQRLKEMLTLKTEKDLEVLQLIELNNSMMAISRVLERPIGTSILRLRNNKLIDGYYESTKINEKGIKLLDRLIGKER